MHFSQKKCHSWGTSSGMAPSWLTTHAHTQEATFKTSAVDTHLVLPQRFYLAFYQYSTKPITMQHGENSCTLGDFGVI